MESELLLKTENILKPISVQELTIQSDGPKYRFYIPSYQRGYRWGTTEVEAILDDILEFSQIKTSTKERYCLQPIVVKKMSNGAYEVLDGQQRLTTIFILLTKLRKKIDDINLFSIEYETRPNSKTFLDQLDNSLDTSNPDFYYMSNAYITINNWFEGKKTSANVAWKIYEELIERVDFIWYEITDPFINPIDVFTRINIGKIPLTNSELVKAVFLSKENLALGRQPESDDTSYKTALSHKQALIAMEWDQMEKQLQDKSFWSFIYNGDPKRYETRIDYILDLITGKTELEQNKYFAFQCFYNRIKEVRLDQESLRTLSDQNSSFVEQEWNKLKQYFDILLEWYTQKTFNHLIGFLIFDNINLIKLLDLYKDNDRKLFLDNIIKLVKKSVEGDLSTLRYNEHNRKIHTILVFHNIMHSLIQPDTSKHFPFERIKDNVKWSLEHIYAQNSDDIREVDQQLWAVDHWEHFNFYYPEESGILFELDRVRRSEKTEREEFLSLFKQVDEFIQAKLWSAETSEETDTDSWTWLNDEHAISNLTLLDVSSNSVLSNSVFAIKRDKIKKLDIESAYIPSETRKVFFKYYTKHLGNDAYWTRADKIAYVNDIESMISKLDDLKKIIYNENNTLEYFK